MISYLGIGFPRQAVINYNIPDLFHLVRFALSGMRLQIENFGDAIAEKYVVAAFDALLKAKRFRSCTMPEKGIFASAPPLRIWSRSLVARAMVRLSAEA
jgi:hypothetical protein